MAMKRLGGKRWSDACTDIPSADDLAHRNANKVIDGMVVCVTEVGVTKNILMVGE